MHELGGQRGQRARDVLLRLRGDEGQGIFEFALIMGALLLLVFGSISLDYGFEAKITLTAATRAAARVAAIECGNGSATWYSDAEQTAYQNLRGAQLPVVSVPASGQPAPGGGKWGISASCTGSQASVTLWYNAPDLFPAFLHAAHGEFAEVDTVSFPVE